MAIAAALAALLRTSRREAAAPMTSPIPVPPPGVLTRLFDQRASIIVNRRSNKWNTYHNVHSCQRRRRAALVRVGSRRGYGHRCCACSWDAKKLRFTTVEIDADGRAVDRSRRFAPLPP